MSFQEATSDGGKILSFNRQESLPGLCPLTEAVDQLATSGGIEARGAIYTRKEVVDFMLNLAGYTAEKPLYKFRLLEPSFGGGEFLLAAIDRLLTCWIVCKTQEDPVIALSGCLCGVELHRETFAQTKTLVIQRLQSYRLTLKQAEQLADVWLINDDFLLVDLEGEYDFVIGNPPYVRQELIPDILITEYRSRYSTVFDRADLYIPFIERSLIALARKGTLSFICSDRWMKNRYGGPLRKLISGHFHLNIYVDMVGTQAFHSDVIAYPAITVITREQGNKTRVAFQPLIDSNSLRNTCQELLAPQLATSKVGVRVVENVVSGAEPWILGASEQLAVIRRLEAEFPLLEDTGCKVGIGVATGADKAFIGSFKDLDVEDDRKLPLVMTRDIQQGTVQWRGLGVINPFAEKGGLVDLANYPRLTRYLEERKDQIAGRHCAKKTPANWYRTIDRITPEIASKPKLLIPDIKGKSHIVYEEGKYYPHHNLYYITSDQWDLKALQAVLLSCVTRVFIATYSTKMHGGFLRFQAQYLRRLRLPLWCDVPASIRTNLIKAAEKRDITLCNQATFALYGLYDHEISAITSNGE